MNVHKRKLTYVIEGKPEKKFDATSLIKVLKYICGRTGSSDLISLAFQKNSSRDPIPLKVLSNGTGGGV
jgi:hypothetical protein